MNITDAILAEPATGPAGSLAASPPSAPAHSGPMTIRHLGREPSIHPQAYVAPSAVISGQVSIGAGSCIMHGAVLAAEGGPVQIGVGCVIMEHAVLRGTARHPLLIGDHVLAGPHAQLTGATVTYEVFIAAGEPTPQAQAAGRRPVPNRRGPTTKPYSTADRQVAEDEPHV